MRVKLIAIIVVALAAIVTLTCSPVYLLRAGYEEGKILSRRQPIEDVLRDPATGEDTRRKLELVRQARTFADHALGLDAGESYTTYSWVERDTLALVLSAARKDRFEQRTWWFPIVGHVPYKGFFSESAVRREAERLEAAGYDTYVRPTAAFSTLGWFNDPLLSTTLRSDDVSLASTVVHELTHNSLYLPSQVAFNESFATFVGDRGAIELLCGIEGGDGTRCRTARQRWADRIVFAEYLQDLVGALEDVYSRDDLTAEQRIELRERVFEREQARFRDEVEPRLATPVFRGFGQVRLNNARLVSMRLYYDRLGLFESIYQRYGGDLRAAVAVIMDAARDDRDGDPFAAVGRLSRRARPGGGQRAAP